MTNATKKIISLVTVACFVMTQSISANPGAGIDLVRPRETPSFLQIDIPSGLATLDGLFEAPAGPDPRLILHIQNAHANFGAQQKIKELLQYLEKTYAFKTIFVEGASEDLNPDYLKMFPDKERNLKLANFLAEQGELTGAELYLLEQDGGGRMEEGAEQKTKSLTPSTIRHPSSVRAHGIERADLYRENYEALKTVFGAEKTVNRYLGGFERRLDGLASKVFSPDLRKLLAGWKKFEKGHREFMPYIRKLSAEAKRILGTDLESLFAQVEWPQITRLLVLQTLEKDLNTEKGLAERDAVIRFLKEKRVSAKLIQAIQNFQDQRVSVMQSQTSGVTAPMQPRDLMEQLVTEAGPKGFKFSDYPNFSLYAGYLILKSELDPKGLFDEIKNLFTQILDTLAQTERQKILLGLFRDEELVRKLLNLELTRKDWQEVLARKDLLEPGVMVARLKGLVARDSLLDKKQEAEKKSNKNESRVPSPESRATTFRKEVVAVQAAAYNFYEAARKREEVFYEKINSVMDKSGDRKAVLITGGFHTDGITELLREHEVSYGILTPRLSEKSDENLYRAVMLANRASTFELSYLEAVSRLESFTAQGKQLGEKEVLKNLMPVLRAIGRAGDFGTVDGAIEIFNQSRYAQNAKIQIDPKPIREGKGKPVYQVTRRSENRVTTPEVGISPTSGVVSGQPANVLITRDVLARALADASLDAPPVPVSPAVQEAIGRLQNLVTPASAEAGSPEVAARAVIEKALIKESNAVGEGVSPAGLAAAAAIAMNSQSQLSNIVKANAPADEAATAMLKELNTTADLAPKNPDVVEKIAEVKVFSFRDLQEREAMTPEKLLTGIGQFNEALVEEAIKVAQAKFEAAQSAGDPVAIKNAAKAREEAENERTFAHYDYKFLKELIDTAKATINDFFIARDENGKIVGYIITNQESAWKGVEKGRMAPAQYGYLLLQASDPSQRKSHIASKLIATALTAAYARGWTRMRFRFRTYAPQAIFWRKVGERLGKVGFRITETPNAVETEEFNAETYASGERKEGTRMIWEFPAEFPGETKILEALIPPAVSASEASPAPQKVAPVITSEGERAETPGDQITAAKPGTTPRAEVRGATLKSAVLGVMLAAQGAALGATDATSSLSQMPTAAPVSVVSTNEISPEVKREAARIIELVDKGSYSQGENDRYTLVQIIETLEKSVELMFRRAPVVTRADGSEVSMKNLLSGIGRIEFSREAEDSATFFSMRRGPDGKAIVSINLTEANRADPDQFVNEIAAALAHEADHAAQLKLYNEGKGMDPHSDPRFFGYLESNGYGTGADVSKNPMGRWISVHLRDGNYQGAMKKLLAKEVGTSDALRTDLQVGIYSLDKYLKEKFPGSATEYTDISEDKTPNGKPTGFVTVRLLVGGKPNFIRLKILEDGTFSAGENSLKIPPVETKFSVPRSELRGTPISSHRTPEFGDASVDARAENRKIDQRPETRDPRQETRSESREKGATVIHLKQRIEEILNAPQFMSQRPRILRDYGAGDLAVGLRNMPYQNRDHNRGFEGILKELVKNALVEPLDPSKNIEIRVREITKGSGKFIEITIHNTGAFNWSKLSERAFEAARAGHLWRNPNRNDALSVSLKDESVNGLERLGVQELEKEFAGEEGKQALAFIDGLSRGKTEAEQGGLGRGLSSVKEFTEDFGGSVQVQSSQASGTTVSILLPSVAAQTSESRDFNENQVISDIQVTTQMAGKSKGEVLKEPVVTLYEPSGIGVPASRIGLLPDVGDQDEAGWVFFYDSRKDLFLKEAILKFDNITPLVIFARDEVLQKELEAWLTENKPGQRVIIYNANTHLSSWARDRLLFVRTKDGLKIVLPKIPPSKFQDIRQNTIGAVRAFANAAGIPLVESDMIFEGGNILFNGEAVLVGQNMIDENIQVNGWGRERVVSELLKIFGTEYQVYAVSDPFDFHLDVNLTLLPGKTVIVGDPGLGLQALAGKDAEATRIVYEEFQKLKGEYGHPDQVSFEKTRALTGQYQPLVDNVIASLERQGFYVRRVPIVLGFETSNGTLPIASYNNVVIKDGKVFLPQYGLSTDADARKAFESLGYEVVPLNKALIPMVESGCARCIFQKISAGDFAGWGRALQQSASQAAIFGASSIGSSVAIHAGEFASLFLEKIASISPQQAILMLSGKKNVLMNLWLKIFRQRQKNVNSLLEDFFFIFSKSGPAFHQYVELLSREENSGLLRAYLENPSFLTGVADVRNFLTPYKGHMKYMEQVFRAENTSTEMKIVLGKILHEKEKNLGGRAETRRLEMKAGSRDAGMADLLPLPHAQRTDIWKTGLYGIPELTQILDAMLRSENIVFDEWRYKVSLSALTDAEVELLTEYLKEHEKEMLDGGYLSRALRGHEGDIAKYLNRMQAEGNDLKRLDAPAYQLQADLLPAADEVNPTIYVKGEPPQSHDDVFGSLRNDGDSNYKSQLDEIRKYGNKIGYAVHGVREWKWRDTIGQRRDLEIGMPDGKMRFLNVLLQGKIRHFSAFTLPVNVGYLDLDPEHNKSFGDNGDTGTYGPYYIILDRSWRHDEIGDEKGNNKGGILEEYHKYYLVPNDAMRKFLIVGLEKALAAGLIDQEQFEARKGKIVTYKQYADILSGRSEARQPVVRSESRSIEVEPDSPAVENGPSTQAQVRQALVDEIVKSLSGPLHLLTNYAANDDGLWVVPDEGKRLGLMLENVQKMRSFLDGFTAKNTEPLKGRSLTYEDLREVADFELYIKSLDEKTMALEQAIKKTGPVSWNDIRQTVDDLANDYRNVIENLKAGKAPAGDSTLVPDVTALAAAQAGRAEVRLSVNDMIQRLQNEKGSLQPKISELVIKGAVADAQQMISRQNQLDQALARIRELQKRGLEAKDLFAQVKPVYDRVAASQPSATGSRAEVRATPDAAERVLGLNPANAKAAAEALEEYKGATDKEKAEEAFAPEHIASVLGRLIEYYRDPSITWDYVQGKKIGFVDVRATEFLMHVIWAEVGGFFGRGEKAAQFAEMILGELNPKTVHAVAGATVEQPSEVYRKKMMEDPGFPKYPTKNDIQSYIDFFDQMFEYIGLLDDRKDEGQRVVVNLPASGEQKTGSGNTIPMTANDWLGDNFRGVLSELSMALSSFDDADPADLKKVREARAAMARIVGKISENPLLERLRKLASGKKKLPSQAPQSLEWKDLGDYFLYRILVASPNAERNKIFLEMNMKDIDDNLAHLKEDIGELAPGVKMVMVPPKKMEAILNRRSEVRDILTEAQKKSGKEIQLGLNLQTLAQIETERQVQLEKDWELEFKTCVAILSGNFVGLQESPEMNAKILGEIILICAKKVSGWIEQVQREIPVGNEVGLMFEVEGRGEVFSEEDIFSYLAVLADPNQRIVRLRTFEPGGEKTAQAWAQENMSKVVAAAEKLHLPIAGRFEILSVAASKVPEEIARVKGRYELGIRKDFEKSGTGKKRVFNLSRHFVIAGEEDVLGKIADRLSGHVVSHRPVEYMSPKNRISGRLITARFSQELLNAEQISQSTLDVIQKRGALRYEINVGNLEKLADGLWQAFQRTFKVETSA